MGIRDEAWTSSAHSWLPELLGLFHLSYIYLLTLARPLVLIVTRGLGVAMARSRRCYLLRSGGLGVRHGHFQRRWDDIRGWKDLLSFLAVVGLHFALLRERYLLMICDYLLLESGPCERVL